MTVSLVKGRGYRVSYSVGIRYSALSGLYHHVFYAVGLRTTLVNGIPSGLTFKIV